jgi:hypothetical protein
MMSFFSSAQGRLPSVLVLNNEVMEWLPGPILHLHSSNSMDDALNNLRNHSQTSQHDIKVIVGFLLLILNIQQLQ